MTEIPSTHKGQLDAILALVGGSDFGSAQAAITQLQGAASGWRTERQALFASLGGNGDVPEHYDFAAGVTALRSAQQEIFAALGVTTHAAAVEALTNLRSQLNSLNANQTTIFAKLGATDLAGAMRAISDIDGRIEAGVQAGVIARAASAGLTAPVEKPADQQQSGGAKTVSRVEFAAMNAKQQLEFSRAGGKIVEAAA